MSFGVSKGSQPVPPPWSAPESIAGYQRFLMDAVPNLFKSEMVSADPAAPALEPGAPRLDVDGKPLRPPAAPRAPALIFEGE